jgi:exodeoxyribonuclease V alpha subunit
MEYLNCSVHSVVYQNEETGYSVVKLLTKKNSLPITCVGYMPSICKGLLISIEGYWDVNNKYGKQFFVQRYTINRPTTCEGVISFLASGILSNIGPIKAKKIVDKFGRDTLEIIETNPEKLIEVSGIGRKTIDTIKIKWSENEKIRKLMLFFKEFDVSASTVNKIYKRYGLLAQEKVSKNPYILCEEIYGIGFSKADKIAQNMGFSHDSYRRIRFGLLHIMREAQQEGHTCQPKIDLCKKAVELLDVPEEKVLFSLDHMSSAKILINDKGMMYLPVLYYSEVGVARNIVSRLNGSIENNFIGNIDVWLSNYEQKTNWNFEVLQKKAIKEIVYHQCMIITGGPGTGKTTILKAIVDLFEVLKKRILLAAPTGRAAQRIKETTGRNASTIHRLLEYTPVKKRGDYLFSKNENNKLDADLIVIDEVSMMDIQLMYHLCCAVKRETKILFVGDNNQLPSVGAGNVLSDMIGSNCIPHVQLITVFRQAEKSRIITAAHEINNGIVPSFLNKKEDNCFFIEQSDPQKTIELLVSLVTHRLPDSYKLNPVHDIQVLSPMHKGILGTENINMLLQNVLHTTDKKVKHGQFAFYLGDKVLQIKNNYEKNVYNGDIGFIIKIIDEFGLIVDFNGNVVTYNLDMLDELLPAYCISIHKSQGSEFNAVVVPIMTQHYIMLQRNLVYTALTRAKQLCVFIGNSKALYIAVETNKSAIRYSSLAERIHNELK